MPTDLRGRRKQETRVRIADAAMDLFTGRGFDAVSVAAVARAAGVTEKTVFNHFPTKADLVYGNDDWFQRSLVSAVSERPQGSSVLQAAAEFLLDRYTTMLTDVDRQQRQLALARLVRDSEVLRVRERQILARYADALAETIAGEVRAVEEDLRPRAAADAIVAVHRAAIDAFRRAARSGLPPADYGSRVIDSAREAFAMLARGMGGYASR